MFHQHFTDKDKADTLAVRLGGEERGEQHGFRFFADALSGISDFQHERRDRSTDGDAAFLADAFRCVLDDVDQYLFEKRGVNVDGRIFIT